MSGHRPTRPLDQYPAAAELPPLPPPGLPDEPDEVQPAAPASADLPDEPVEIAALRFLDPAAIETEVPLRFPFEWEGREVRSVRVRRLSAGEVGQIAGAVPDGGRIELYSFFSAMTDLPAPVLRGMIEADNRAVTDAARPFLPDFVEALFFGPTSVSGGDISTSPSGPSTSPGAG